LNLDAIDEQIVLMRGGEPVRSLFGSFGLSLKETRLTAALGFLISQEPSPWQKLFHIRLPLSTVTIESNQQQGRADIWLESLTEKVVIEAKVTEVDPSKNGVREHLILT
jgi:hypothetical protein